MKREPKKARFPKESGWILSSIYSLTVKSAGAAISFFVPSAASMMLFYSFMALSSRCGFLCAV